MEQKLRQRLVGAAVLVALAVIFVPMLLTGPVDPEFADVPIEIPPQPAVDTSLSVERAGGAAVDDSAFTSSLPLDERPPSELATLAEAQPPLDGTPSNDAAAGGEPAQDAAAPEPPPAPAPVDTPAVDTPAPAPELAAWAVQVGSFGDTGNAEGLRDRLRAKGYSAFMDTVATDGKTFYRVRVGPIVKREEAEALQKTLAGKESLEGLVVSHP